MTPSRRLLFWLRISFLGDAGMALIAVLLLLQGESAGWFLLVFVGLRAGIGVVALVIAQRTLADRRPGDDRPSTIR